MTPYRLRLGTSPLIVGTALVILLAASPPSRAQDCTALLGPLQQGLGSAEIAEMTGVTTNEVERCRRALSQPVWVGPAGLPPAGAAGPAPRNAAGPPPRNAPGPPPLGAAGPPPIGRDIKRLP